MPDSQMNTTLRHTEYLLTTHNCVVIPGFGAVLRRRREARFDDDGRLLPPDSTYAFNSELRDDDGLLVSSVTRATGLSHNRAASLVAADVENMLRHLEDGSSLALGRIGEIMQDRDGGTIKFRAAQADMLSPLASWMPVVEKPCAERYVQSHGTVTGHVLRPRLDWRRMMRTAAAIAAIAIVAMVCSTPISVPKTGFASTALPKVSAPRPAYVPSQTPAVLSLVMDGTGCLDIDTAARNAWRREHSLSNIAEEEVAQVSAMSKPVAVAEPRKGGLRFNEADHYIVVVASLHNREDAERTAQDFNARYGCRTGISATGSYYRVYAATGATRRQAIDALSNPQIARFNGAWVTATR